MARQPDPRTLGQGSTSIDLHKSLVFKQRLIDFFCAFLGCTAIAHFLLGWGLRASWLAGVALLTTSVARVLEQVKAVAEPASKKRPTTTIARWEAPNGVAMPVP